MSHVMPESLINFEVYSNDNRLLGLSDVELGELEFLSTEIKGNGIAGSYDNPIVGHIKSPEIKLKWRTLYDPAVNLLSTPAKQLSLRGAQQHYDSGTGELKIVPVRIDVRARTKSSSLGKFEPGEQVESETTLICDYLKITVSGTERLEWDCFNYIYKVFSTDYLENVRTALGL